MKTYSYLYLLILLLGISTLKAQTVRYDSTKSDYMISNPVLRSAPVDKPHPAHKEASVMSGGGSPTTVFNPCTSCSNISTAMYSTDANANLGFEKGDLSEWTFYIGSNEYTYSQNYAPLPTYDKQAHFECANYYTYDMLPSSGPWSSAQLDYIHKRVTLISSSETPNTDPAGTYLMVPTTPSGQNDYVVRMGAFGLYDDYPGGASAPTPSSPAEMAVKKVIVTKDNPYITMSYAITLAAAHSVSDATYFRIQVYNQDCEEIPCLGLFIDSSSDIPGVSLSALWYGIKYKAWTSKTIDLSQYFTDPGNTEETFTLAFSVSNCKYNGHFGYAYVDLEAASGIKADGVLCSGSRLNFSGPFGNSWGETASWNLYKYNGTSYVPVSLTGITTNQQTFSYLFNISGDYRTELTVTDTTSGCSTTMKYDFHINDCAANILTCDDCIKSFAPLPGEKYVLSAWVKEDFISGTTSSVSYTQPKIGVTFTGTGTLPTYTFSPSGPIIDGWQKIEQEFTIPATANYINLTLNGSTTSSAGVYFDDIRVFPFRADMRSFVYDPNTQKLMAELDENNFATFYEYDEEGKLRRVKKETERGVMTIKESGGNTHNK